MSSCPSSSPAMKSPPHRPARLAREARTDGHRAVLSERCCSTSVNNTGWPRLRAVFRSAGQMQPSPRAPRQRCSSSNPQLSLTAREVAAFGPMQKSTSATAHRAPAVAVPARASIWSTRPCGVPHIVQRDNANTDEPRARNALQRAAPARRPLWLLLGDRSSARFGGRRRSSPPWDQHRRPGPDYCFDPGASTKAASTRCALVAKTREASAVV